MGMEMEMGNQTSNIHEYIYTNLEYEREKCDIF